MRMDPRLVGGQVWVLSGPLRYILAELEHVLVLRADTLPDGAGQPKSGNINICALCSSRNFVINRFFYWNLYLFTWVTDVSSHCDDVESSGLYPGMERARSTIKDRHSYLLCPCGVVIS